MQKYNYIMVNTGYTLKIPNENSILERHSNVHFFYIFCKTMLDKVDQLAKNI